jgi:uncharacterized membrane protein YgaE (UPF0421/DUF939 family)
VTDSALWDAVWARGRLSARARLARLRSKSWHVAQASLAAGVAWFIAGEVFHHPTPFFAPIAAVVGLGTTYAQRWRRVTEISLGVAVGVFTADMLVRAIGNDWWQLTLVVGLSMSIALLLDAGGVVVTQAAVQSIVVSALAPPPGQAFLRWTDALIGGGVALVAATVVPAAPLRRPRDQAAKVLDKIGFLLRGAAEAIEDGDVEATLQLLSDARSTDVLIGELQAAADEGLSVVRSSPFRFHHSGEVRRIGELVEPLDLALRNTRVVVRRAAVAAYRRDPVPSGYALLIRDLAEGVDEVAAELRAEHLPAAARPTLLRLAAATAQVERTHDLTSETILAQLRSIIADLLRITGLDPLESTDAIPPLPLD